MNKETLGAGIGTAISATATIAQTNELFEYIQLIITIIGVIITVVMAIINGVSKLKSWFNKAKKDGKIDEDEKKEALEIAKESFNDIKENVNIAIDTLKNKKEDK